MSNPEKPTIDLWLALNLAQQALAAEVETMLSDADLPPLIWFEVLYELEFAPDGLRPFQLREKLLFKQANLSRLLKTMVGDGVINEHAVPGDGRGKTMQTTQKGRALSRRMWRVYSPALHAARDQIAATVDPDLVTLALRGLVDRNVLDHFEID